MGKIIDKYLLGINLGGKRFLLLFLINHEILIFSPSKMTDYISSPLPMSPIFFSPSILPSSSLTHPPLPLRSNIASCHYSRLKNPDGLPVT